MEIAPTDDPGMFGNSNIGSGEAPVQVVLEGTSTVTSPTQLKFRLESAANQANVAQKLELFNFSTGQYELRITVKQGASIAAERTTFSVHP